MFPLRGRADIRNTHIALVAVILFLMLDTTAIALNFWLSWKIEERAVAINLAGRQRMLSQRMVKVLFQLDQPGNAPDRVKASLAELALSYDLFDKTLRGFDQGHLTRGGAGETLFLGAIKGGSPRAEVDRAVAVWAPYRQLISRVLQAGESVTDEPFRQRILKPALRVAERDNLVLLEAMNRLTTALELQARHEARQIRIFQSAAFGLALLNFIVAFVIYARRIREFSHRHNLLDEIINKIASSVMVLDPHDVILKANHQAESLFGFAAGGLLGIKVDRLLDNQDGHLVGRRKDGSSFFASMERNRTILGDQELQIVTVLDVTRHRTTEVHLSALAYNDPLTQLPNRLLFDDRLQVELSHAARRNLQLAVLYIDLDGFKPINDTYGHQMGDLLLQAVAGRMKDCLRDSDTLSRWGGDEFALIASEIGSPANAIKVAETLLAQFVAPFLISGVEIRIGASIGISLYPKDATDAESLISHADAAMYQAKLAGRGCWRLFSDTSGPG